jgi:hypothetical protein
VTRLRDRPTADLIVLGLLAVVTFAVVISTLGVIALDLMGHDQNVAALAGRLADITNTLIAAIVGYLAGRGVKQSKEE